MLKVLLVILISFTLMVIFLPILIKILQRKNVGQKIRKDGPQTHLVKEGVPSMGGILFVPVLLFTGFLFLPLSPSLIWTAIMVSGFALIGFADDYLKFKGNRSLGLKARQKLFLMFLLSSLVGLYIYFCQPELIILHVPFFPKALNAGKWIIPLVIAVYIATANSVNLSDGLDGLVAGLTAIASIAFLVISLQFNNCEGVILSGIGVGICGGFLWFNCHPAKIIMGDTGSLMLGAFLASLAVFMQLELFLIIIGGVFVAVALSVIIQVVYFKLSGGKRIFRMAPLHHHFELSGWSEPQTVIRFWIAGALFATLALGGIL